MANITRKQFLRNTALLAAGMAAAPAFAFRKRDLNLAFSTLGCPDWTFEQFTEFAKAHGYRGIELRGILRQMDLPLCAEFGTAAARKKTTATMKKKGLRFVNLGSSATLHFPEGAERDKQLADGKRFIDLASQIDCPYIRVFPNNFPKDENKVTTMKRMSAGLRELGEYADGKGVTVLMETHGDAVHTADLLTIMKDAEHKSVGLVWDPVNMWTVTQEPPAVAYDSLKKYIRHAHIKDAKMVDGKPQYTYLGRGEVPVFEAINSLVNGGYKGYYSFEWEKLWHPELSEPGPALADYADTMRGRYRQG